MKKRLDVVVFSSSSRLSLALLALLTGCVVERIEEILAEHSVTYAETSSGEATVSTGTDISTSTGEHMEGSESGDTTVESGSGTGGSGSTSESSGSSGSSGSSSGGGPVCGDGVKEGEETCDDGNMERGDGCQECAKDSTVFVSSEVYQGYGLGGLYGADQRCRSLAAKAALLRPETYRAWLSTAREPVEIRLKHSRGRYVLVNGLVVAEDWVGLTGQPLKNPIMADEKSQNQDARTWTGTHADGTAALGSTFCTGWDDDTFPTVYGGTGLTSYVDSNWSYFEDAECGSELHIYCVEQ